MPTPLRDLNPEVFHDRILYFDCPAHGPSCRRICVPLVTGPSGQVHRDPSWGWTWTGDWATWRVTLLPSVRAGHCGVHLHVVDGDVHVDP